MQEMLELLKMLFIILRGFEALGLVVGMAAAANLAGPESTELYNRIQWKLDQDNATRSTNVDNSSKY